MNHIDKEMAGIKDRLSLLIEKKNYFDLELLKTADPDQKFSIKKKLEELENEIALMKKQLSEKEALQDSVTSKATGELSSIPSPRKIFFSYSKDDRPYLDQFLKHLTPLKRQGKIVPWDDSDLNPGEEWDDKIKSELANADIIILLVSANFLATDYIWDIEIKTAMERHERGEARVVPIILKHCDWTGMPFSKLSGLPAKGRPVEDFDDQDKAWTGVVEGLKKVLNMEFSNEPHLNAINIEEIKNQLIKVSLSDGLKLLHSILPTHQQDEVLKLQDRLRELENNIENENVSFWKAGIERAQITRAAVNLISQNNTNSSTVKKLTNITQTHLNSGDNIAGDKIGRQINIGTGNYIENQHVGAVPEKSTIKPAKKILFAAANPSNATRLQTDLEHRTIQEEMQKGSHREAFQLLPPQLAVRIGELLRALKDKPTILHFAGHGKQEGIMVANDQNQGVILNNEVMKRLFKPLIGATELILLNSCYSAHQAQLISRFGFIVIGHNLPIGDKAAVSFAKGFYLGLSEGMSYEEAFSDGITTILAESEEYAHVVEVWKDGNKLEW
jgi:hypothetical protein